MLAPITLFNTSANTSMLLDEVKLSMDLDCGAIKDIAAKANKESAQEQNANDKVIKLSASGFCLTVRAFRACELVVKYLYEDFHGCEKIFDTTSTRVPPERLSLLKALLYYPHNGMNQARSRQCSSEKLRLFGLLLAFFNGGYTNNLVEMNNAFIELRNMIRERDRFSIKCICSKVDNQVTVAFTFSIAAGHGNHRAPLAKSTAKVTYEEYQRLISTGQLLFDRPGLGGLVCQYEAGEGWDNATEEHYWYKVEGTTPVALANPQVEGLWGVVVPPAPTGNLQNTNKNNNMLKKIN